MPRWLRHIMFAVARAGIIFALGSILFVGGCGSSKRTAEQRYQEGIHYKARGDLERAVDLFYEALTYNSHYVDAYIELGILMCRYKQYPDAVKYLLRAIEHGADSYKPYAYMGYAYEQLDNVAFSVHYYRQAIHRAPQVVDVRLHLADMLEAQGKRQEAAGVLEEILTINQAEVNTELIQARIALLQQPESREIHREMADAYLRHGEIHKGITEYHRYLPLDPGHPENLAKFGILCAEREQYEVAARYLEQAAALGLAERTEARIALGTSYEQLGKIEWALGEYQAALRLEPELSDIRLKVVALLEKTGKPEEAADMLEKSLSQGAIADASATWSEILRLRGEDSNKTIVEVKRVGQYKLIDAVVGDEVPATLLFDKDAEYTIISEELAEQLHILLSTQTSEVHFFFNGQPLKAPLVNLSSVKVGELEVRNVPSLIWDFSEFPELDGVLGKTFLKHFQVDIHPEHQLLVLTR